MWSGKSACVKEWIVTLHAESGLEFQNLIVRLISEKKLISIYFSLRSWFFFLYAYVGFSQLK